MWNYEKRLQFPVNITRTDPKMAQLIISQYGGPDGEANAAMRYLAQRYTTPTNIYVIFLRFFGNNDISIRIAYKRFLSARRHFEMEVSVKNHTDVLIFYTDSCAGASQLSLMAEEKSHSRISLRPVANAPEWRLIWRER